MIRRMMHEALPVDLNIKKCNIYMASKCSYCRRLPKKESTMYLCFETEMAMEIYDHFKEIKEACNKDLGDSFFYLFCDKIKDKGR